MNDRLTPQTGADIGLRETLAARQLAFARQPCPSFAERRANLKAEAAAAPLPGPAWRRDEPRLRLPLAGRVEDARRPWLDARAQPRAVAREALDAAQPVLVLNHDAPFGGIGDSGMGTYHGAEGFRELSHAKTVFQRHRFFPIGLFYPPYGNVVHRLVLKL